MGEIVWMTVEPLPAPPDAPDNKVELTLTLSKDMIAALKVAAFERRSLGEPDFDLQRLVCEALSQWLERKGDDTTVVVIEV